MANKRQQKKNMKKYGQRNKGPNKRNARKKAEKAFMALVRD